MKRILLVCIAAVFSVAGFSQSVNQVKEFALSEIRSSDELEYEMYTYNSDLLLKATDILFEDGTLVMDSLYYDAFKNVVKLNRYQLLNGNWTHVSYIDYTYDENGNRLSRSNYNNWGGSFNLGGIYNYFYDENNKLTNWELLMSGTDLFQAATFTYNASGQLIEELGQDAWNSGTLEDSWKLDYQYNSDGTLKYTGQSFWNGYSWDTFGTEWFFYDDQKNCIKWDHKSNNTVTNRHLYDYNLDYTIDQFVMPYNPEEDSQTERLIEMNNMVTVNHWYTENDVGTLVYVCDYIYKYDIIDYTDVPTHGFNADNMRIYPNPASDFINITSDKSIINNIEVVDNAGKVVLNESINNKKETKLDVSNLKSGVYYIRALTSKGMVTEKLVVQ